MSDIQRAIEVIQTEKECVIRQQCDRNCGRCDLVMQAEDILSAYDAAIAALQEKKHNDELRKNGRLVELPCAVNDILYTLVSTESGGIIRKAQVKEIKLKHRPFGDSVFMVEQVGRRGLLFKYYESDFGKSVFYTQEEAETELTNREEQCDGN